MANLKKNIYVKASPRTKNFKEECSAKHNATANMVKKLVTVLDVLYSNTNNKFDNYVFMYSKVVIYVSLMHEKGMRNFVIFEYY